MQPIFSTSKTAAAGKMYVEPRPFVRAVKGSQKWRGTSAALVRSDVMDPRMSSAVYGHGLLVQEATDDAIEKILSQVFATALVAYKKQFVVKRTRDDGHHLSLAVYSRDGKSYFMMDTGIAGAPDTLYAADTDEVDFVVNAPRENDATLVACTYTVEDSDSFARSIVSRLSRV